MKFLPTFSEDRSVQTAFLNDVANDTVGETYIEEDPSVAEWFRQLVPTSHGAAEYARDLFPSARWLRRYNLHWLAGDAIAGMLRISPTSCCFPTNKNKASRSVLLSFRKPWRMLHLPSCHLPLVSTLHSQARVYTGSSEHLETSSSV
jgi:hypothetical protein